MIIYICLAVSILAPSALSEDKYTMVVAAKGKGEQEEPVLGTILNSNFFLGRVTSFPTFTSFLTWHMKNTLGRKAGKTNNLFVQIFFLQQSTGKTSLKLNSVTATTALLLLLPLTYHHQPPHLQGTITAKRQVAPCQETADPHPVAAGISPSRECGWVAGVSGHLMNRTWWLNQKEHHSLF